MVTYYGNYMLGDSQGGSSGSDTNTVTRFGGGGSSGGGGSAALDFLSQIFSTGASAAPSIIAAARGNGGNATGTPVAPAGGGFPTWLVVGGLVVGGLFLFKMLKRK